MPDAFGPEARRLSFLAHRLHEPEAVLAIKIKDPARPNKPSKPSPRYFPEATVTENDGLRLL